MFGNVFPAPLPYCLESPEEVVFARKMQQSKQKNEAVEATANTINTPENTDPLSISIAASGMLC